MPNYKKMYFKLAARVADVVEILTQIQQEGEERYCADQTDPIWLNTEESKDESRR